MIVAVTFVLLILFGMPIGFAIGLAGVGSRPKQRVVTEIDAAHLGIGDPGDVPLGERVVQGACHQEQHQDSDCPSDVEHVAAPMRNS